MPKQLGELKMDISQRGIDLIVSFEGKHTDIGDGKYEAYLDRLASPHVWTIYCGLTKGVRAGMVVTKEEGDKLFHKELAVYEDAVERFIGVPLNQNQFDALVSFTYNCGSGALERSTLRKVLNQGKYDQVPAQLMRWVKAGGKTYRGLQRRRQAEGSLFMEPMPDTEPEIIIVNEGSKDETALENPMPQRVEEAPAARATDVVKESWTIRSVIAAALAFISEKILTGYEFFSGVVTDAGPEILSIKQNLSPLDPLIKLTPWILSGVVLAGLGVAAARRFSAAKEGKIG